MATKVKPNPNLFVDSKVGRTSFKPLKHKDGTIYTDLDYFELLGRKCIELDRENRNSSLPTDYGTFDRDVVKVAKEICKGIDEGMSKKELQQYLSMCIDINQ